MLSILLVDFYVIYLLIYFKQQPHDDIDKRLQKQVDILISKNQALQLLYLKHCVYKTT